MSDRYEIRCLVEGNKLFVAELKGAGSLGQVWRERAMRAEGKREKLQALIAALENKKEAAETHRTHMLAFPPQPRRR